jgi:hypothetical protein
MTPTRAERIARAVEAGVEAWPQRRLSSVAAETGPQVPTPIADVVQPMPRRAFVHKFDDAAVTLPMAHRVTFRPGVIYPLVRLLVWVRVSLYFFCGNVVDMLHRRDSLQRRAVRLRRQFEAAGGSFGSLNNSRSAPIFCRTPIAKN